MQVTTLYLELVTFKRFGDHLKGTNNIYQLKGNNYNLANRLVYRKKNRVYPEYTTVKLS